MEFQGKRVLVTGGARGLGATIVRQFVELGATVFALDKEESLLAELKKELPSVTTLTVDLTDWDSTKKLVESVAPIHHLVNNAGIAFPHALGQVDEKAVDLMFGVNFKSYVNVSQAVVKGLADKGIVGGTIVNVSSVLGSKVFGGSSMYCCSKAAVTMLTRCQAVEFAPLNVRVNCIRPTFMATGLVTPESMKKLLQIVMEKQLIKEQLQTKQAADLVIFLSSEKSAMINSEDVVIDGGLLSSQ